MQAVIASLEGTRAKNESVTLVPLGRQGRTRACISIIAENIKFGCTKSVVSAPMLFSRLSRTDVPSREGLTDVSVQDSHRVAALRDALAEGSDAGAGTR